MDSLIGFSKETKNSGPGHGHDVTSVTMGYIDRRPSNSSGKTNDRLVRKTYRSELNEGIDIWEIIEHARTKNGKLKIGGALWYDHETRRVRQVLEGEEDTVENLTQIIMNDTRHTDVVFEQTEYPKKRHYSKWMANCPVKPVRRYQRLLSYEGEDLGFSIFGNYDLDPVGMPRIPSLPDTLDYDYNLAREPSVGSPRNLRHSLSNQSLSSLANLNSSNIFSSNTNFERVNSVSFGQDSLQSFERKFLQSDSKLDATIFTDPASSSAVSPETFVKHVAITPESESNSRSTFRPMKRMNAISSTIDETATSDKKSLRLQNAGQQEASRKRERKAIENPQLISQPRNNLKLRENTVLRQGVSLNNVATLSSISQRPTYYQQHNFQQHNSHQLQQPQIQRHIQQTSQARVQPKITIVPQQAVNLTTLIDGTGHTLWSQYGGKSRMTANYPTTDPFVVRSSRARKSAEALKEAQERQKRHATLPPHPIHSIFGGYGGSVDGQIHIYNKEEKKQIIKRYLAKKKSRKFRKVIRYACRKRFADRRPRVGGRFVKMKPTPKPKEKKVKSDAAVFTGSTLEASQSTSKNEGQSLNAKPDTKEGSVQGITAEGRRGSSASVARAAQMRFSALNPSDRSKCEAAIEDCAAAVVAAVFNKASY